VGNYKAGVLKFVLDEFKRRGFVETAYWDLADVFWSRSFYTHFDKMKRHQKVNFVPAMAEMCRKDLLSKHIDNLRTESGRPDLLSFWPETYRLPMQWEEFKAAFEAYEKAGDFTPFILKPPFAARGEGIQLATSIDQVDVNSEFIQKKIPIAQRYIQDPLLFDGFKMTFRVYAVVTSFDPLIVYAYTNGLTRICSIKSDFLLLFLLFMVFFKGIQPMQNHLVKKISSFTSRTMIYNTRMKNHLPVK